MLQLLSVMPSIKHLGEYTAHLTTVEIPLILQNKANISNSVYCAYHTAHEILLGGITQGKANI